MKIGNKYSIYIRSDGTRGTKDNHSIIVQRKLIGIVGNWLKYCFAATEEDSKKIAFKLTNYDCNLWDLPIYNQGVRIFWAGEDQLVIKEPCKECSPPT